MPLLLEEDSIIPPIINDKSALNALLKSTSLLIIDEVTMATRKMCNAIDRSIREALGSTKPFGGLTVVWSGDFRQTLPVVNKGGKAETLHETVKESDLWHLVKTYTLTKNMRLSKGDDTQQFSEYLLRIGEGREEVKIEPDMVKIPDNLRSMAENSADFCREIFPNLKEKATKFQKDLATFKKLQKDQDEGINSWSNWLMSRAIITPTNAMAEEINQTLIRELPSDGARIYRSFDSVVNDCDQHNFPTEYLNTLQLSSIPPHVLELRIGCPIMLIRNLDIRNGFVNGSRYIVTGLGERVIEAMVATGPHYGKVLMIPRIIFKPEDKTIPFEFQRKQYPIKLCFGLTSNKSQGQSFQNVGIYLQEPFFGHGKICGKK